MGIGNNIVELILKARDMASGEIKKVSQELGLMGKAGSLVKGVMAGFTLAAIVGEAKRVVISLAEQEAAEEKLAQAMKNRGIYSQRNMEQMKDTAGELGNLNTVSRTQLELAERQMVQYGILGKDIYPALRAAIDLAAGKEISLSEAVSLVGRAAQGHTEMLAKMGIRIDDNVKKGDKFAATLKAIKEEFGGQGAATSGWENMMKRLGLAVGSLEKTLATFMMGDVGKFWIKWLTEAAQGWNDLLKSMTAMPDMNRIKEIGDDMYALAQERKSIQEKLANITLPDNAEPYLRIIYDNNIKEWKARLKAIKAEWVVLDGEQRGLMAKIKKENADQPKKESVTPPPGPGKSPKESNALSTALDALDQVMQTAEAKIDSSYKLEQINLETYYAERMKLITEHYAAEASLINAELAKEKDPNKRRELGNQLLQREEEKKRAILELDEKRVEEEKRIAEAREKAAKEYQELSALYAKAIGDDAAVRAADRTDFERGLDERIAALKGYYSEEDLQRKKAAILAKYDADQAKALQQQKLQNAQLVASGMADLLQSTYEVTGKKSKELFIAAKLAAAANIVVSTAVAAMKAYETGPIIGPILAAIAIAQGAVNLAQVRAQTFAFGGPVGGWSPHSRADNIPARLTAGEYVQPVDAVQFYGGNVMEALRRRLIPRNLFAGLGFGLNVRVPALPAYADGGSVGPAGMTIVNYFDRREFEQFLGSSAGRSATFNLLSSDPARARRALGLK